MSGPTVSVVLAVWNGIDFLDRALDQIERQTSAPLEIIVVDDASDDGTGPRLDAWALENPRAVVMHNETRSGVAASRNRAVARATGDYLWFTDVDDEWSPEIIERMLTKAAEADADLVICSAVKRRIDRTEGGTLIADGDGPAVTGPEDALRRLMRREIQGHLWNKLLARSLFNDIRFPLTRAFSDLGAMSSLLVTAKRVELVDEVLYTYLLRPGSIINSRTSKAADLLEASRAMRSASASLPPSPGLATDMIRFEYGSVIVPTLHSLIVRGIGGEHDRAVRHELRSRITPAGIVALARSGSTRPAASSFGLRYLHPVYAAAYRGFRRAKWGVGGVWG